MKLNKLFLAGAIALGLAACKNSDVPDVSTVAGGETTYVTLQMKVNAKPGNGTRAAVTGTFAGTDAEQLVENVHLYIFKEGSLEEKKVFTVGTPVSGGNIFGKESGNTYQTMAVKTTPGVKTFYLVVNPSANVSNKLGAATTRVNFEKAYELLVNDFFAANHANFLMTGFKTQELRKGVKQAEADAATAVDKNLVTIDVERVASKVSVVALPTLNKNLASGTIGNLTYSVQNSNKSAYIFRKGIYDTPNMNQGPWQAAWQNLYWQIGKAGDASEYITPLAVNTKSADLKTYNGKYFLENSNVDNANNSTENWFWGNTTTAKVYTTFIPKVLDGVNNTSTAPATFYKGYTDGLYYSSGAKAKAAGNEKAYKYQDGKCGYSILLNADTYVATDVSKSPTQRNEYYILEIEEIKGPGYPYEPVDPTDPNLPKPDPDPETPDPGPGPGPEEPLPRKETWMRVKAIVLDWKTVTNTVTLEQ